MPFVRSLTVLSAALLLGGCFTAQKPKQPDAAPQLLPGAVAAPIVRTLPTLREITGRIDAAATVEVKPQIAGIVAETYVADGAEVTAGQLILRIDEAPQRAAMLRADAARARAAAVLRQANADLARARALRAGQAISAQQLEGVEATLHIAEADLAAAEAIVASATLDLGYTQVTAPIAGRIGKLATTKGNLVQGGGPVPATLITTLVALDPVEAVFDLDEASWLRLAPRVNSGTAGGVSVAIGIAGQAGFPHRGTISSADNRIDSNSGSIRLRARLANPDRTLTPGAFARVQVELGAPRRAVLVNERAVLTQLTSRFVLVVGPGDIVSVQPVTLGDTIAQPGRSGLRVVESGLTGDERIVVAGPPITLFGKGFFPGKQIMPLPGDMETAVMPGPPGGAPPHAAPASAASATASPAPSAKPATSANPPPTQPSTAAAKKPASASAAAVAIPSTAAAPAPSTTAAPSTAAAPSSPTKAR